MELTTVCFSNVNCISVCSVSSVFTFFQLLISHFSCLLVCSHFFMSSYVCSQAVSDCPIALLIVQAIFLSDNLQCHTTKANGVDTRKAGAITKAGAMPMHQMRMKIKIHGKKVERIGVHGTMLHQTLSRLIIQAWIQKLILGGKGMSFLIAKEVDSAQMMMHGKTCGRTDAFQFPHNQRTLNHLVTAAFLTSQFVLLLAVLVRLQKLLLD